ncbi:MAG: type II secretion system secretin GspD [Sedimentisphaerales bacterium]|nr:type II secretion system secretin GspD [Sedimentisphaerales bacterium]
MRTKRNHIVVKVKDTIPAEWPGLLTCLLIVVVLGAMGCGLKPEPVSSQEVSPVQFRSRPRPKVSDETQTPQPSLSQAETTPNLARPQQSAAAVIPETVAATDLPEADALEQQAEAQETRPVQTPVAQSEAADPFETPAAAPRPQPPTPLPPVNMPALTDPGMADEPVSVNFEAVDIHAVLKTIGGITGINFIPHESVTGKVTVMSPTPIRLGELYGFLQSILDVCGYATIESENVVKVVPKADAIRHSTQVRIGSDPAFIPRNDAMVTQIMPLQYATAAEISEIIKPILPASAQTAVYPRNNTIMITDTSANIFHAAQIIQQLDVEGSRERVLAIPLQFAAAQVLSEQITRILERSDAVGTQPIPRTRAAQPSGQPLARVLPDERTNSVIAVASEQEIETIRQLVRQLDIPRPTGAENVRVAYLKNADANEVAAALNTVLASMRITGAIEATQPVEITAHASTNSLIIAASTQDYEVISKIIEKLDIVREQVLVEMRIVEITEEALKEIGIDWATLDDAVATSLRGFAMTNFGPRVDFANGDLEGLALGVWKGTNSDVKIAAILQALERENSVNILSMPHITTSNHRKARIVVGENRAFLETSRVTESDPLTPTVIQGFEYRDVGITLEITPHVSQGGLVRLDVNSEFTKLLEDVASVSLTTPVTAKRTAETVITIGSGSTVVIGGLIRDDKTRVTQKVPIIGDIPLFGALFRTQRDRVQKTNLLIFITPTVMANAEQMQEVANQKQQQLLKAQEGAR